MPSRQAMGCRRRGWPTATGAWSWSCSSPSPSPSNLKIGERRRRKCRVGVARDRQAHIGSGSHVVRHRTNRRPGRPGRRKVTGELVALSDQTQPDRRSTSATGQPRRTPAFSRSRLHKHAALWHEHQEDVLRVRAERLPNHHPGLRIRIHVLEAREPDTDVDVAGDLPVREPKFVGGAPDVGSAASDHPRARRDGSAPHYSRTANVPGRPT